MPRLLQINITANWGSHGRIAEEIGQLAMSQGWESYIAYGRWANPSQSHLIRIGSMWDERWHGLQSRIFDNQGLASKRATQSLVEEIGRISPDIIHLHNIHGYYLNYPLLFDFLSKANVPIVWTFHDCWPFTGHCAHPSYASCSLWYTLCKGACPLRKEYPASYLFDKCERNFLLKKQSFGSVSNLNIVTVSDWLKKETEQSFLGNKIIHRIYNGIDTQVFEPKCADHLKQNVRIGGHEKVVLGVANVWDKRKGLYDFFQIREKLDHRYAIILIGLSANQIKKLPEGIIGLSRTESSDQLAEYYSMADVYVNTSQAETFGMTTSEALSCGTPAIVYNTTACPEIVSEETGAVVELGDISAMVDKIQELCNISALEQKERRKLCRQRAVALFNKNDRYQEYLDLYNSLLKQ